MNLAALAEVLEAAAARARELVAEERAAQHEWIDQQRSPLGRKRHCAAVRRLIGEGNSGAGVAGRRHLLSPQALEAELARGLKSRPRPAGDSGVRAELERELRLVRLGR